MKLPHRMRISVVYSPVARQVREVELLMDEGATVAQALLASGLLAEFLELAGTGVTMGVWGRKCTPQQVLRDLDRVEIYRCLKVDPKAARRARFVKQGVRSAGLFARKRPGAKAGY